MTRPPSTPTTPSESCYCPSCDLHAAGLPSVGLWPYCRSCGSTDLLDTRSPYEVLHDVQRWAEEAPDDPGVRGVRREYLEAVAKVAAAAAPDHCSECRTWARRCRCSCGQYPETCLRYGHRLVSRCEACGATTESPGQHEHNRHDGAQTCWPVAR